MRIASFVRGFTMSALLAASAFAADVTGKWVGKMETPNGSRDVVFNLKQDGDKLTGTTTGRGGDTPIADGAVKGDAVTFSVTRKFQDQEMKTEYKGTVTGATMKMKFEMMGQARELDLKKE